MRCRALLASGCLLLCGLVPLPAQQLQQHVRPPVHALPMPTPKGHITPSRLKPCAHAPQSEPRVKTFEYFPTNVAAFRLVNSHRARWADVFFSIYYWLGNGYFLIPVGMLIFFFRRKTFAPFLIAVALQYITVTIIKNIAVQPRPPLVLYNVHILQIVWIPTPFHLSFPSGDVAQAFATAVPLMVDAKWPTQLLLFLSAALIGYERMYVGVHFPLDVMTGALIGTLSAATALYLVGKFRKATVLTAEEMAK